MQQIYQASDQSVIQCWWMLLTVSVHGCKETSVNNIYQPKWLTAYTRITPMSTRTGHAVALCNCIRMHEDFSHQTILTSYVHHLTDACSQASVAHLTGDPLFQVCLSSHGLELHIHGTGHPQQECLYHLKPTLQGCRASFKVHM